MLWIKDDNCLITQQWYRDITLLLDGAYSSRIDGWILTL